MGKVLVFLLKMYQRFLSPFKLPSCRFFPSCSSYAIEAILKKGTIRGSILAIKRVVRCHSFSRGGYDPVE